MNISRMVVGWVLLLAGIILIAWTLMYSYDMFTGKQVLVEFFTFEIKTDISPASEPGSVEEQIGKMMEEKIGEMFPQEALFQMMNLVAWSVLAFLLIFGGAQVAGIGIKLLNSKSKPKEE